MVYFRSMPTSYSPLSSVFFYLFAISIVTNMYLLHQLYQGSVVSVVYDGDSFELADGRRVRLMGVDAPERGRCGYEEAKKELSHLVLGKKVRLKNIVVDDFGRLVANVEVIDGIRFIKVNSVMVGKGLAKNLSTNSPYKRDLDEVTIDAKKRGLGIYSPQCRSDIFHCLSL